MKASLKDAESLIKGLSNRKITPEKLIDQIDSFT
jgi:hypothetical protein